MANNNNQQVHANNIVALRHQNNSVNMVRMHPEIAYCFLIGGYGCG